MIIVIIVIALTLAFAWPKRIDIIVWAMPKINEWVDPIAPNRPIIWQQGPATAAVPPQQLPPNIVLILVDDMGFNDVSLYNGGAADGTVVTPSIDAIAQQGVMFNNGYAANAVCAPSRAAILTGRYSTRFGFEFTPIFRVGATLFNWIEKIEKPPLSTFVDVDRAYELPEMDDLGMPSSEITIAEVLQQAEYYTAHIGKWHLGGSGGMEPTAQGFDDSLYMEGLFYLPEDHPNVVNAKQEESAIEKMVWSSARYAASFNESEQFQPDGYLTDYYTNEAVKVIENNKNRPFFLYLAHWSIHNPLQATREDYDAFAHIEDHTLRVYAGMIRALDRSIGRVTEALEANGLTENTLVIFTSDNGGAGYIGLPNINKPYRGWKLTHFEGGTHVPFMAKWPQKIDADTMFEAPVHHVDLFHTIAAAAGVSIPKGIRYDGVDLVPFITGKNAAEPHETLFWRQGHQQSVLHKGWKLIRANEPEKSWLFNLAIDPTEQENLAEQYPEKTAQLHLLLDQHNEEQADPLWPSVLNAPQLIDKPTIEPYAEGDEYIYWPN